MRARLIPLLLMLAFVLLATSLLTPAAAQPVSQIICLPVPEALHAGHATHRHPGELHAAGAYAKGNECPVGEELPVQRGRAADEVSNNEPGAGQPEPGGQLPV